MVTSPVWYAWTMMEPVVSITAHFCQVGGADLGLWDGKEQCVLPAFYH